MRIVGIYKITSPNGSVYIGQSIDMKRRFFHYRRLHKVKGQQRIYNSLIKYGPDKHEFSVLHKLPNDVTEQVLAIYEQLYMDQYKECGIDLMNLRDAGIHGKFSNASREKMRQSQLGKRQPKHVIEKRKQSNIKYKHSEETKKKIGDANKKHVGRKLTEEHKRNMSIANLGKVLSEEHRKKIGAAQSGVKKGPMSEDRKNKISKGNLGKPKSKEAIEKSAIARKGQKRTLEMREKMRQGQLLYRQKLKNAV